MAVFRTDSGKTFNLRGLQKRARSAQYEFATEMNARGRVDVANGMGAKAKRTISRVRNATGR
jgi:hypothetical protein